ncbi:unnamed protein product [Kuraishia capsulata CBS 1993]|uniref:GPI anchored protein n=1 Tax=Kuraishia capsulata CBS 1993 TaxID=1382522 RepID=W6MFG5_9ASCO|nr:uncharacterized protein KUCA_T00000028001 [Kuraishia capsulata CBS 1993]CDK24068.1 unnamed protein product [Kuraishia capsulata CBS 1993]
MNFTASIALFLSLVSVAWATTNRFPESNWGTSRYGTFTSVSGFFLQSDSSTNATSFDFNDNLGLKPNYTWNSFKNAIEELNANSNETTSYKVIFFGRHGEGYHNVAESYYGTPAWNCYWSLLTGNGTSTWGPDAGLTPKGVFQAQNNSDLIKSLLPYGFPLPQNFYSSPMTRAADTLTYTWNDIALKTGFVSPIFKESLRETIGLHRCDERRSKTYLKERYPDFQFENGFVEDDLLWTKDTQEPDGAKVLRLTSFLNDLWASDPSTYVSVTAHSGVGSALLSAVGHRSFSLSTGAIIPIVVRRDSILGFVPPSNATTVSVGTSATAPSCTVSIGSLASSKTASLYSQFSKDYYQTESYSVLTVTSISTTTATVTAAISTN